jgi:hypothetical protein
MQSVLFVSVAQTFDETGTLAELEPWVERAWPLTVSKAASCDRVVAVFCGEPVGAWRLRGAFPTDETYVVSRGETRPRIGLALGDPLPILPAYRDVPALRRGVCVKECDVLRLPKERIEPPDFDPDGPDQDEHVITRGNAGGMFYPARCSCGWETVDCDNPHDLEVEIAKHEEAELGESTDVYLEDPL